MFKFAVLPCVFVLFFITTRASADIGAIHSSALPQETAVLAALDDARQLEPYSHNVVAPWRYSVSKDEVAARLGKDLGFLRTASNAHPDNAELALLTGLVARYAYNVDVEGSYDAAMDALGHAEKETPTDIRASWFRSTLLCQTLEPEKGAEGFLQIESNHPWEQLPSAFWDDYLECASVTSMPAHALRAADHLKALHAPESQMRDFLAGGAAKRFIEVDLTKFYDPSEFWSIKINGAEREFTATACSFRLRARINWGLDMVGLTRGTCVVSFSTGPYQATKHALHPSILFLVQPAKEGQSLEQFALGLIKGGAVEPIGSARCPADSCLYVRANQHGMYKKDGDGIGRLLAFERVEPAFPGLLLEDPVGPPKPDAKEGTQYFRPVQVQHRMSGKLYYGVLLDAATSIEEPALKDYEFFLNNLTVE